MRNIVPATVIIPAFNAEPFLEATLNTVRSQTVDVDEIIVVDDGSTDSTASLAERFGVRVIRQQKAGPGPARNAGLQAARSEWIATLDADDAWHPRKLEIQYAAVLCNPEIGLAFTDFDVVSLSDGQIAGLSVAHSKLVSTTLRRSHLCSDTDLLEFEDFLHALPALNIIHPSAALFRRTLACEIGGFSKISSGEDAEFFLRLAGKTRSAFISLPLVAYMRHDSQLTATPRLPLVQLDLFQHVMATPSAYHQRVLDGLNGEYAKILYSCAAYRLAQGRYLTAALLSVKTLVIAILHGRVPDLARALACSQRIRSLIPRRLRGISSTPRPMASAGPATPPIDVPWRTQAEAAR